MNTHEYTVQQLTKTLNEQSKKLALALLEKNEVLHRFEVIRQDNILLARELEKIRPPKALFSIGEIVVYQNEGADYTCPVKLTNVRWDFAHQLYQYAWRKDDIAERDWYDEKRFRKQTDKERGA